MFRVILIPSGISQRVKSNAEKKVFSAFQSIKYSHITHCLHSLNVPEHVGRKPECEIDFVFVSQNGILCLEIKGGEVSRDGGVWRFKDRTGNVATKIEGPFKQVQRNMYSLRERLKRRYGDKSVYNNIVFGYGVVFPDFVFDKDTEEWDKKIVCDKPLFERSFSDYLDILHNYWVSKRSSSAKITDEDVYDIVDYLRGDFSYAVSLGDSLKETESKIIKYTEEQCHIISSLERNQRLLIRGSAGTGKTILAIEKGISEARSGNKVLFVCFNRLLALYLSEIFEKQHKDLNVTVTNIFGLMKYIISIQNRDIKASVKIVPQDEQSHDVSQPAKTLSTLQEKHLFIKYDSLIIDEGQDILKGEYFEILNRILKNGFSKGRWTMFYDKHRQGGLYGEIDAHINVILSKIDHTELELTLNCRNTKKIADATETITKFKFPPVLCEEGEGVTPIFYSSTTQRDSHLLELLGKLKKENVNESDIIILTVGAIKPLIDFGKTFKVNIVDLRGIEYPCSNTECVFASEAKLFKGLESKIVIIPDIESLDDPYMLYVAMTRANIMLFLLMNTSLRNEYALSKEAFLRNWRA